jgi:hypothetical protein
MASRIWLMSLLAEGAAREALAEGQYFRVGLHQERLRDDWRFFGFGFGKDKVTAEAGQAEAFVIFTGHFYQTQRIQHSQDQRFNPTCPACLLCFPGKMTLPVWMIPPDPLRKFGGRNPTAIRLTQHQKHDRGHGGQC